MGLKLFKKRTKNEKSSVEVKEEKELKKLAAEYAALEEDIRLHKSDNDHVFGRLEDLETEKEVRSIRIKEIARKAAIQGKTLNLVDMDKVVVQVSGNQAGIQFDWHKANHMWPPDVLERCSRIDSKEVFAILKEEHEFFTEKRAMRAALPLEAKTPAVTIRVKL